MKLKYIFYFLPPFNNANNGKQIFFNIIPINVPRKIQPNPIIKNCKGLYEINLGMIAFNGLIINGQYIEYRKKENPAKNFNLLYTFSFKIRYFDIFRINKQFTNSSSALKEKLKILSS